MAEKIFGIDLGTTNSEIALIRNGSPEVLPVDRGKRYLPSVVGVDPAGNIVTGFTARNQYAAFPENTVKSIKRKMGSGQAVSMGGKEYRPAEISSYILKALKEAAERETGLPCRKVVITVPAYFNDLQRKDTIEAGELAGLEVVRLLNEPTAAALAYGCRKDEREKILVYDLGGGTFDISIIEVEEGVIEVIATDGDSHLGGDDFDRLLKRSLVSRLPQKAVSPDDLRAQARLMDVAESVKIELSTETRVDVREEFISSGGGPRSEAGSDRPEAGSDRSSGSGGGPVNLETTVTRRDFESCIDDTLGTTFAFVRKTLGAAGLTVKDINKALLVGGSTHIPRITATMREELGFDVHREVDPTYCVALGAAIQGAIVSGGQEVSAILVDVNAHSLGIRCAAIRPTGYLDDDKYSVIIPKNTPIPASMSETYYTMVENQKGVDIEVYQGENPTASKNTLVGSFRMDKLPKKLPEGSEIDVSFEYNLSGVVEVSAMEKRSGRKEKISVDVNRLEKAETPGRPEALEAGSRDRGRIERILKTARKKRSEVGDAELAAKLDEAIGELERVESESTERSLERAGEKADALADLIARL